MIRNKSRLRSRDDFEWGVVKCALIVFSASKQNEWKMGLMKALILFTALQFVNLSFPLFYFALIMSYKNN